MPIKEEKLYMDSIKLKKFGSKLLQDNRLSFEHRGAKVKNDENGKETDACEELQKKGT